VSGCHSCGLASCPAVARSSRTTHQATTARPALPVRAFWVKANNVPLGRLGDETMIEQTFKLTLGPKQHTSSSIRHADDYTREVLIDFDTAPGAHLGFISVLHGFLTGKVEMWFLFDEHGNDLPGLAGHYSDKAAALAAARGLVERITRATPA